MGNQYASDKESGDETVNDVGTMATAYAGSIDSNEGTMQASDKKSDNRSNKKVKKKSKKSGKDDTSVQFIESSNTRTPGPNQTGDSANEAKGIEKETSNEVTDADENCGEATEMSEDVKSEDLEAIKQDTSSPDEITQAEEQSDVSGKKKGKKKVLSFLRKKTGSQTLKKKDKGKTKTESSQELAQQPNKGENQADGVQEIPEQKVDSIGVDQQAANKNLTVHDITDSDGIVSPFDTQQKDQDTDNYQNTNERESEGHIQNDIAQEKDSVITDQKNTEEVTDEVSPKEKPKKRFKFKKKREKTDDSDSQQSVKQGDSDQKDEDSESSAGTKKATVKRRKSSQVSVNEGLKHDTNNSDLQVGKEEEKRKRRKSAKVHPAELLMLSSQIQNQTDENEGVSELFSHQIDQFEDTSESTNCARIIPQENTASTEETEKDSVVRTAQSLQLLGLPTVPWIPTKYVDEPQETGFIDIYRLYNQMSDGTISPYKNDPSCLLILDTRGEVPFDEHHVATAKHAASLLKQAESDNQAWPQLNDFSFIVLYDENGLTLSLTDSILSQTLDLLQSKGLKPLILKGGYKDFHEKFAFLCVPTDDKEVSQENDILDYPSVILNDQLYIGRGDQAAKVDIIRNLNITHIVNASTEYNNAFEDKVTYINVPVKDDPSSDLQSHFLKVIQFIHDALESKGQVLVHCSLGASRSAALVIAYLMMTKKWTAANVAMFITAQRPIIAMNRGFLKQIKSFEKKLFGKNLVRNKTK